MKKFRFFTRDKTSYAFLLFFFIAFADLTAVLLGFGGAAVLLFCLGSDMPMFSTYESLVISSCAVCLIFLTALYAYRTNQPKKLKAIAAANVIMSFMTIMMNSLYYPFTDMISHTIYRITDIEYFRVSDLTHYLSLSVSVPMCILCFVLLFKLKRENKESADKASFRCTARVTVTVFILVTVGGLAVCNILPSEAHNNSGFVYIGKNLAGVLHNAGDKRFAERTFERIDRETDYLQAKEMLRQSKAVSVFPSENGKVKIKKIKYGSSSSDKTTEAGEIFETLKLDDDKKSVLKKMKKVSDITSVSVEYTDNTVRETYEFSAFNDISFLHLIEMEWFDGTVVFENGILKEGNYVYAIETNAETDDVVRTEEKYTIAE